MEDFDFIPYDKSHKEEWDIFVDRSKNGTFLLKRDYMDYHSDRFQDYSFLIYKKNLLYALLPACIFDDKIYSHAGLTYGGLVMNDKCITADILQVFSKAIEIFRQQGYKTWLYKPVPEIYHDIPSQEDLYAIFRNNANLIVRNVSSVINLKKSLPFQKLRTRKIKKASLYSFDISEEKDFNPFWQILEDNLRNKYNAKPVHSLLEIEGLAKKFPDNIKLFTTKKEGKTLAGVVCYIWKNTVHCQYITASPAGKETGALDLLFNFLIKDYFSEMQYFDFGTSNEDGGKYLNQSLIFYKEGFGGRAVCYDTYLIPLS